MKQGLLRFIIYKRPKDKLYTGVCLDLDIVEEGKDPEKLRKSLEEAAQGYIEAIVENNLSRDLLNRPAPKKYWKILSDIEKYLRLVNRVSVPRRKIPVSDSQFFIREIDKLSV